MFLARLVSRPASRRLHATQCSSRRSRLDLSPLPVCGSGVPPLDVQLRRAYRR